MKCFFFFLLHMNNPMKHLCKPILGDKKSDSSKIAGRPRTIGKEKVEHVNFVSNFGKFVVQFSFSL